MSVSTIKRYYGKHSKLAIFGAVALLMVCSSRAGSIKVVNLPATSTDASTGISTTNTYLCCIDFGNNASPHGNINEVPFIHPNLSNQIVNTTNGVDTNFGGNYTIATGGTSVCQIARTTSSSQSRQADGLEIFSQPNALAAHGFINKMG